VLGVGALEVAVLDRGRLPRRAFRRITGNVLRGLLPVENRGGGDTDQEVGGDDAPAAGGAVEGS
jgi:proteasome alpha subunit